MSVKTTNSILLKNTSRGAFVAALLASSSLAGVAMAQTAAASTDTNSANQLEEVVVTARLRNESLQTTPVAVSVVSGALVRQENRNNIVDLVALIPSVETRTSPSNKDASLLIRGLGTITTSPGAEPTVSTVVDGVVLARPGQMVTDIVDLDRVEVLRGPQGTLFGKNASAGVINIITANPTPETSGHIEGAYYQGNEYRISGAVNGEIVKGILSGRLAGVTSGYEGNVDNIFNGTKNNGYKSQGFRGKLLFTPTENFSVLAGVDYTDSNLKSTGAIYVATYNIGYPSGVRTNSVNLPKILAAQGLTASMDNTDVSLNSPSSVLDMNSGAFVQANYTLGGFDLTSITAFRYWRNVQRGDLDGYSKLTSLTPTQQVDLGHVWTKQYTQEFRLSSPKGKFLDYVVGLYFMHAPDKEDYRRDTTQLLANGSTVANYGYNQFGATPTHQSVFGEANLNFTERFRALVGARLVDDKLRFYSSRYSTSPTPVPGINPSFVGEGSAHVKDYAGRVGLQYDVNDSTHAYVTYSRGYKGPAFNVFFNQTALQTNTLNQETSKAFEAGLKSRLFDRRLQFNVAVFNDDVSNYQANQPDIVAGAIITRLINAGDVSTKGIEIDAVAKFIDNLTLSVDYTHLDARIEKFNCPPNAAASCQVDGKTLPLAPKDKVSVRAQYVAYQSDRMSVDLNTNYTWQSEQQNSITQTPDTISPSYGVWNASVALTDNMSDWSARLVVRNILDQQYRTFISQANGGLIGQVPRDFNRYFGLILRKNF